MILTTYGSLADPKFVEKPTCKGIVKFIAHELDLDLELVRERYGQQFQVIVDDLKQDEDLRVLDYNGHHVFYNFSFKEMGSVILHE